MAGTIVHVLPRPESPRVVSMESGLDGRNNPPLDKKKMAGYTNVSMESGLDGRNNLANGPSRHPSGHQVSMESGLDGRNNRKWSALCILRWCRLNGVRPRWPEQCALDLAAAGQMQVSQWSPA